MNVIEDITIFTGEDPEPENYFPTFHIHSVNACLSIWTGNAKNCMFHISSEMWLADELNTPEIKQDVIQKRERDARLKLITNFQIDSWVKVQSPTEWHAIYWT